MWQSSFVTVLILGFLIAAHGQGKPVRSSAASPIANTASKPKPPKYLTSPLDLMQANLGSEFIGHDITAVIEAIKNSPSVKEKSEFESTSAFEARRAGFVDRPLYANVLPRGYLGFIVGEQSIFAPEFRYDADSQTLAVTLSGRTERFIMDTDKPTLDGILIRRIVRHEDTYVGSNAFGAKVEVRRTYSDEYGVAFDQNNWLFRSSSEDYGRKFTYLLAMSPDQARALKANGKFLLVCRLSEPWLRHSAHGHDATINEPYETVVGDNYLQVVPEQLWIFDARTGEVVRKLSALSLANEGDQQLSLKLRQTPLLLEVSGVCHYRITIDGGAEESDSLSGRTKTFGAKRMIVFTLLYPQNLFVASFRLNGKPYTPVWSKDVTRIGDYESIHSATALITVP